MRTPRKTPEDSPCNKFAEVFLPIVDKAALHEPPTAARPPAADDELSSRTGAAAEPRHHVGPASVAHSVLAGAAPRQSLLDADGAAISTTRLHAVIWSAPLWILTNAAVSIS